MQKPLFYAVLCAHTSCHGSVVGRPEGVYMGMAEIVFQCTLTQGMVQRQCFGGLQKVQPA